MKIKNKTKKRRRRRRIKRESTPPRILPDYFIQILSMPFHLITFDSSRAKFRFHFTGTEPILQLGPPSYVFSVMVGTVFVYLIPSAIISTDISIAMPLSGGYVAWIDEAFGETLGAQNMNWFAP